MTLQAQTKEASGPEQLLFCAALNFTIDDSNHNHTHTALHWAAVIWHLAAVKWCCSELKFECCCPKLYWGGVAGFLPSASGHQC